MQRAAGVCTGSRERPQATGLLPQPPSGTFSGTAAHLAFGSPHVLCIAGDVRRSLEGAGWAQAAAPLCSVSCSRPDVSLAPTPTPTVKTVCTCPGDPAAGSPCFLCVPQPFPMSLLILH